MDTRTKHMYIRITGFIPQGEGSNVVKGLTVTSLGMTAYMLCITGHQFAGVLTALTSAALLTMFTMKNNNKDPKRGRQSRKLLNTEESERSYITILNSYIF